MRIGIDARLIDETGVGRYIRNLIRSIGALQTANDFVVFLPKKAKDFTLPSRRWKKVITDIHWHTLREQIEMPMLFRQHRCDIVHIPYFNVPVLYHGNFVMTVHDLTILKTSTGKATTRHPLIYAAKRIGYRFVLQHGLKHAAHLIAVSHATKHDVQSHFHVSEKEISVTYEGVDVNLLHNTGKSNLMDSKYLLYVGNAYPHKNLEFLVRAFSGVVRSHPSAKLVLVGEGDMFYQRLKTLTRDLGLSESVKFWGRADDEELASLYRHAQSLVFPSLFEGFGLPALEAVAFGCHVICSDIEVFREILPQDMEYIDPSDEQAWINAMLTHSRSRQRSNTISQSHKTHLKQFSWSKMGKETMEIYERCARL